MPRGENVDRFISEHGNTWDIIVASDCIYNTKHAPQLLDSIRAVSSADSVPQELWFSFAVRNPEREQQIVEELTQMFPTVEEV